MHFFKITGNLPIYENDGMVATNIKFDTIFEAKE